MITYEIRSPVDALVMTFDCPTAAKRWVLAHKHDRPGCRIDQVETITIRTAVYRPRQARAA